MRLFFRPHPKSRSLCLALASVLLFALTPALSANVNDDDAHEIKAPYYGNTLFYFFQDQYFTAATDLMVSQHFGRVAPHTEEAEILRGGILLSYGLQREAGEIFTRLIDLGATPATRDRAWFYLAKIRYQRGYLLLAEDAIARIGIALPADLQEERGLLSANLLMTRADYAGAVRVLSAMDLKAPGARYVQYNLAIALMKSGEILRGSTLLNELGKATAENEEFRSLRDRANVALGFAAIADKRPQEARGYLERVRLNSPQANKALLGLGWSAVAQDNPKLALVPWLELAQRDLNDTAVLEAHVAVPYAYAQLGAYAQAAERYKAAIAAFSLENQNLSDSISAINAGKLVDALIEKNPAEGMGWFWNLHDVPAMLHARHLAHVLAQHDFQEAFKNYRDLRFLMKNLEQWRDKLTVFDDMLENRRKAFAERLPQVLEQAKEINAQSLKNRLESAQQAVAQAETVTDGVAFADAKQLDLLQRIDSAQSLLKKAGDVSDLSAERERVRLAAGALTWQLAQAFPDRLWQAQKEMRQISEELDRAGQIDAALGQAQRDEPARFAVFGKRIAALTPLHRCIDSARRGA